MPGLIEAAFRRHLGTAPGGQVPEEAELQVSLPLAQAGNALYVLTVVPEVVKRQNHGILLKFDNFGSPIRICP
jgi:hypothetical protein